MFKHYSFKLLFILIVVLLSSTVIFSQVKNDSIIVKESGWGNNYFLNGNAISKTKISKILKENQFSQDLMKTSSRKTNWGTITLLLGLILTGTSAYDYWESNYSYGYAPTSTSFYPVSAIAILGDILGILLITDGQRNFREAIKKYNENLQGGSSSIEDRFRLYLGLNGITLSYALFF